jgi:ABC transporter DrrB family efflux protein
MRRLTASLYWFVSDTLTISRRNVLRILRNPEALFFTAIQPVIFVVMFRYVFGGALKLALPRSVPYVDYLMPGIFVQTVAFGSAGTCVGIAEDLYQGIIERFKALPVWRAAVLTGRTLADLARNCFVIALMTLVGLAVGFRMHAGILHFIEAALLVLLFAYALSWGYALLGLFAPNAETAQVMAFPILFPFTFASSAFVPTFTMPGWLQAFANHQPVTVITDLGRSLVLHGTVASSTLTSGLAWSLGALVVFATAAILRFTRLEPA